MIDLDRETDPVTAATQRGVVAVAIIVTFGIDQITKAIAVAAGRDGRWSAGPLTLATIRNPGGPFGLAPTWSWLWTLVTVIGTIVLVAVATRGDRPLPAPVAWGAIVGGGLGNLADRLVRAPGLGRGAVVDWIQIDPYPKVFNIADVALRVGVVVVVVTLLRPRSRAV